MKILIFRHGIAEDHGPDGDDASRRLTDEGVERTQQSAHGLAAIAESPERILTSPKTRAVQTAKIVGAVFDLVPQICPALADHSPREVIELLAGRPDPCVLLVGHEPTLSEVVELLCTGTCNRRFIPLKKASCCCVSSPAPGSGDGQILWYMPPRMLRALGLKGQSRGV